MGNSVIDDFSVVYGSSKCRVLTHINNGKIYLFCNNIYEGKQFGYKADIISLKGLTAVELLSHHYKSLCFTMARTDGEFIPDVYPLGINIAVLLAFDGNDNPIQLRRILKRHVRKGCACERYAINMEQLLFQINVMIFSILIPQSIRGLSLWISIMVQKPLIML